LIILAAIGLNISTKHKNKLVASQKICLWKKKLQVLKNI
jgi:hypothetical protein